MRRPGTSLTELLCALTILAVLLGLAFWPMARVLDRYGARAGRDALAAGIARARMLAVARGGATLVLEVPAGRFWVEAGGDTAAAPIDLFAHYSVVLAVDGAAADRVELRFDGLGIGRMVNRTVRVRRGSEEAGLTLSSYGRVRKW